MADKPMTPERDERVRVDEQRRPLPVPVHRGAYREVWVGLFVIVGVLTLLTVLFEMTNPSTFRNRYEATAVVPNASGIRKDDPVRLKGVYIGRVRSFTIVKDGVALHLELEKSFPIPSDSRITLQTTSFLGEISANVEPGTSSEPLRNGGVIYGDSEQSTLQSVGGLADQAGQTLGKVEGLLSEQTVGNVQDSARELKVLLGQLSGLATQLGVLTESLGHSATGVERAASGPELARTTKSLAAAAQSLQQSASAAQTILARVDRGEGSLGRLSRDDALYANANDAAKNLSRAANELAVLLQDIRREPKKYFKVSVF